MFPYSVNPWPGKYSFLSSAWIVLCWYGTGDYTVPAADAFIGIYNDDAVRSAGVARVGQTLTQAASLQWLQPTGYIILVTVG